jgi:hypothetical protein
MSYGQQTLKPVLPPILHEEPKKELLASLERINRYRPPVQTCSTNWVFEGLSRGPTSVAYLFLRLSVLYPDLEFKSQRLIEWAREYLELGQSHISDKAHIVSSENCGVANESLCQVAIRACIEKDASLAWKLCEYGNVINNNDVRVSFEWLHGRGGYLYLLRLVYGSFLTTSSSGVHARLRHTIQTTIANSDFVPKPWPTCSEGCQITVRSSLHIMAQVVLSDNSASRDERLKKELGIILDTPFIVALKVNPKKPSRWHDGPAALVLALRSLGPHFPSLASRIQEFISAAESTPRDSEPLSSKLPLHALAQSDDTKFLKMMRFARTNWLEENSSELPPDVVSSDSYVSLYTGETGRAWAWAVADLNMNRGVPHYKLGMIGFNDV